MNNYEHLHALNHMYTEERGSPFVFFFYFFQNLISIIGIDRSLVFLGPHQLVCHLPGGFVCKDNAAVTD